MHRASEMYFQVLKVESFRCHFVLMAILKQRSFVGYLNTFRLLVEVFRRKISQSRGARKGLLSAAVESAIPKYSGLEPKPSISAIMDS